MKIITCFTLAAMLSGENCLCSAFLAAKEHGNGRKSRPRAANDCTSAFGSLLVSGIIDGNFIYYDLCMTYAAKGAAVSVVVFDFEAYTENRRKHAWRLCARMGATQCSIGYVSCVLVKLVQ